MFPQTSKAILICLNKNLSKVSSKAEIFKREKPNGQKFTPGIKQWSTVAFFSFFFFFCWLIYSQKAILKEIKSAKVKCILRFFNSHNWTKNLRKDHHISTQGLSR